MNNISNNKDLKTNTKETVKKPNKLDAKFEMIFGKKKDSGSQQNNSNTPRDRKTMIFEKSSVISEENSDMIIRRYPNLPFDKNRAKIILLMGDNQEAFINSIINIYSDINYKDNYRYKIEKDNSNGILKTYNVYSTNKEKDIFIISFPYFNTTEELFNNEVMVKYKDLLFKKIITKIDYLFITVEKSKFLDKKEFLFFIYFINLLFDEKLKEKIIIFFSLNQENSQEYNNKKKMVNDIFIEKDNYFSSIKNLGFNFNSLFTPEYFYINNKIIYEKNNIQKEEDDWNALSKVIKNLQNKISNSKSFSISNDNIVLIDKLMQPNNKALSMINFPEIKKIEKKTDQIILLNYLIHSNIKNNISNIIIHLFQKIYNNKKLNKLLEEINFKEFKQKNIDIYILSKMEFNNLRQINFQNCDINDQIIKDIQNIFTSKLTYLNLSDNKITNLEIFNREKIFNNLTYLDLSNNIIEDINELAIGKFPNLKKLNLSNNKISNIKCLDNELHFNNLDELDLSYNNISELNKINIPSLKLLTMDNNPLSEGIINFFDFDFGNPKIELIIENINNNKLKFNYSKIESLYYKSNLNITFAYSIEKNNMNNLLGNIKIKSLNKLVLKGFENIDFLINDTFHILTELDLRDNLIEDISIFKDVKFNNLKQLYLNKNITFIKGFSSLKKFNHIYFEHINIKRNNDKYKCSIIYNKNNEINFIFDDLEFFKDELFLKFEKMMLEQSIWNDNKDFFIEAIQNINIYPLFRKKPKALTIKYRNNKYEVLCKENDYFLYFDMLFIFDDLNIFKLKYFDSVEKIEFNGAQFYDKIDLSITVMTNLKKIILKNNIIESIKIISIIKEFIGHITIESDYDNKCNNKLFDFFSEDISFNSIDIYNENDVKLNYNFPFNFYIVLSKKKLNEIKSFKSCKKINLDKLELNDDDINFLKDDTLLNLESLSLNENKISNIEFIDKIKSDKLTFVSIKNNLIKESIKYIENNIKSEKLHAIDIKRKTDDENILILSLTYNGDYMFNFDMFYDTNKNLEFLKDINLEKITYLDLSNLNLKNIDFLLNKSLVNIEQLKLDNNKIEDISVFSEINFIKIKNLSLINNPIRKGLQVIKTDFFKKNINIDINVSKRENEYKIYTEFNNPRLIIELFISNIEDIKTLFDFENCVINLKRNNDNNLNESDIKENQEIYNKVKNIINELQKHDKINKSNDNSITEESSEDNKSSNNNYCSSSVDDYEYKKTFNYYFSNIDSNYSETEHIIIDNGSGYCKAGLSGEYEPRAVFSSCIGEPKYAGVSILNSENTYIGDDAIKKRCILKLKYPIENGYINDWDGMERIWGHIFTKELRVAPEEHNVMITEKPYYGIETREKIAQIMFEYFDVPGLYIANPATLSLFGEGRMTGLVVDSGEGNTNIVPVFDGYALPHATITVDIGGKALTEYLMNIIHDETGHLFTTTSHKEIVKDIKEKACYISLDGYNDEFSYVEPYNYELPDGNNVRVKYQRIECPEVLFKPSLIGKYGNGIDQTCFYSIIKCDIDIRKELYNNIVLAGGTTMFKGFKERLAKGVQNLAPDSMKKEVNIIASPDRKLSAWYGGKILSSLSFFESEWISKYEYEECGGIVVNRKCFS